MTQDGLSKRDIAVLGRKFAELLLQNSNTNPYEFPELIRRKCWQEANAYLRQELVSTVVTEARSVLLASNYDRNMVFSATHQCLTAKGQ